MAERGLERCDQCGKVDDHPKAHWLSGETYHHDCLPYDKKQEVIDNAEHGAAIVAAAESGTHGADLLAHIASLHRKAD